MNGFDRYLFTKLFRFYLAVICSLLILISLFVFTARIEWLTQKQQSLGLITEYILASQANFLLATSPLVFVLCGALILVWLVRDQEWNALAAAGISDLRILRALCLLAGLLFLGEAYLSHFGQPESKAKTRDIQSEISADLIGTLAQPQSFQQISKGLRFFVQARQEDGSFLGLVIVDERILGEKRYVFARQAGLQSHQGRFTLNITDGTIIRFETDSFTKIPTEVSFKQYQFDLFSSDDEGSQNQRSVREDEYNSWALLKQLGQQSWSFAKPPPRALAILSSRFASSFGSLVMLVMIFFFVREIVALRTSIFFPVLTLIILVIFYVVTHSVFRRWAVDWYWALMVNLLVPFIYMALATRQALLSRAMKKMIQQIGKLIHKPFLIRLTRFGPQGSP